MIYDVLGTGLVFPIRQRNLEVGYGTSHRLHWTKAGRVRRTRNCQGQWELIQSTAMWSDRHAVYIRCVWRPESNTRCSPFIFWDRVLWTLLEPPVFAFPAGTRTQVCKLVLWALYSGSILPRLCAVFHLPLPGASPVPNRSITCLCISFRSLY